MGKTSIMFLLLLTLSVIFISGQGQTEQSTKSATTPLPPNDVWYTYDSWIEQYADSLKEHYGFDNCDNIYDENYVLFVFNDSRTSSVRLALFDKEQETFVDNSGKASELYYKYYLKENKDAIVNSIESRLNSQEANVEVIEQFSNRDVVENGWMVGAITGFLTTFINCAEPISCVTEIPMEFYNIKVSNAKGEVTYDKILYEVLERKKQLPQEIDQMEQNVETSEKILRA
jgi:hypothetical protein